MSFHFAGRPATALSTAFRSRTSRVTIWVAVPNTALSSAASSASRSRRRAARMSFAPWAANAWAEARPIPALAPVMKTILSFSEYMFSLLSLV